MTQRFHHEQAMDNMFKQISFLSLVSHAQQERIRIARKKAMILMMHQQNRVPNTYFLPPPSVGPVWQNYMGIGPHQLPVKRPESKGTGAFIPNYNTECCKYNEILQHKPQTKRGKAGGKKEKKHTVPCHTSPEALLPKEWTY